MEKYGLVKLSENDDISIICSWNESLFNRIIDDITNTCTKPVTDLITGEVIKPDPFVFWDDKSMKVNAPKGLTYVTYPQELKRSQVVERLKELRNNPQELRNYIDYINNKKRQYQQDETNKTK